MLDPNWVFLSAALGVAGSVRYAIATLTGTARPNLVTWALWAVAPLIAAAAQVAAGVGLPAVLTLVAGAGPLFVVVAGLVTHHDRVRLGLFDVACGTLSVAALVVWLVFDAAPLAVFVAVGADAAAALPTVRKAWRDPGSESLLFYVLVALGAILTLLTVTSGDPVEWVFAAYMLVLCGLIAAVVALRR